MEETAYKTVLGVLTIWMFLTRMYYQERSRHRHSIHLTPPRHVRLLVASTSLWLLPTLLYIFTGWLDGLALPLPDLVRKIGAVVFSLGILLYWWSHAALSHNLSPFVEILSHHHLVMDGPYARIRHPIYSAVILSGIGLTLLSANWLLAVTYLAPVLLLYLSRVRVEEKLLLEHFGQEYQEYLNRTGRLLPRFFPPNR